MQSICIYSAFLADSVAARPHFLIWAGTVSPKSVQRPVEKILTLLYKNYKNATCALNHRNPFELLVATILSAQCTDVRVNMVTPALFAHFPTADTMAKAKPTQLEQLIRSTGFYRNKAKSILATAKLLVTKFSSNVPSGMDELLSLPGVARKTANVVLGTAFGKTEGVVVDTHVRRISKRLGLTHMDIPEKIERDLMAILPQASWIDFSHMLIHHGRSVCQARKPLCDKCCLAGLCPSVQRN